jgi:uncharacterized membrane protein YraQ (UPF0718 family)
VEDTVAKLDNFIVAFSSILWEALPFIVLGVVIAGILEEMVPQRVVAKFIPRSRFLAILIGGLLGLLFPMCECGIIPVMRRLLRKGVPLSCCTAYLLAGPIINGVVMLSTYWAFHLQPQFAQGRATYQMNGWWMMGMRMGLGYLVAVGTSVIVEWQHRRHGSKLLAPLAIPLTQARPDEDDEGPAERGTWFTRLANISETALHDFVDITVFLILGALVAAFVRVWVLPHETAEEVSRGYPVLAIVLMMGLAIVLCLCSEADAFVAYSFTTLRPSAKLAFLVLGPMLDFKLYFMYTRVFRPRLIWTIIISVVIQVFVYSVITHYVWEHYAPLYMPAEPPQSASPQ